MKQNFANPSGFYFPLSRFDMGALSVILGGCLSALIPGKNTVFVHIAHQTVDFIKAWVDDQGSDDQCFSIVFDGLSTAELNQAFFVAATIAATPCSFPEVNDFYLLLADTLKNELHQQNILFGHIAHEGSKH